MMLTPLAHQMGTPIPPHSRKHSRTLYLSQVLTYPKLTPSQMRAYDLDGGADVRQNFALSGETPLPQVVIDTTGSPQKAAQEIAALNVEKREYQKRYLDYWNSTTQLTGTGRPVDAVICACAPHASCIPTKYATVAYTSFINVLDYTAVVLPVTNADKEKDVVQERAYLSELDRKTDGECELFILLSCAMITRVY